MLGMKHGDFAGPGRSAILNTGMVVIIVWWQPALSAISCLALTGASTISNVLQVWQCCYVLLEQW